MSAVEGNIILQEALLSLLFVYEEALAKVTREINGGLNIYAPGCRAVLSFSLSAPIAVRPCGAQVVYGLGPDFQSCGQPSVRLTTDGLRTWWRCKKHRETRESRREEQSDGRG